MTTTKNVTCIGIVEINIVDREPIERVTGPNGDGWREVLYKTLKTEDDVLKHWAFNAVQNNVSDISQLDGWADLNPGVVTMRVDVADVEVEH